MRKVKEQVGVTSGKLIAGLIIAILVSCVFSAVVCPCARAASMLSMTYGGIGNDRGTGEIIQTSDGGYVIAGDTNSSGAGGSDFWLIKTDAAGNMQWNKTYGGTDNEVSGEMCRTSDGGYALAGSTYSFGAGAQDFYLVKTDASGNMQWDKTYGGTNNEIAYSVVQTSDGGYAMYGPTNSFGAGNYDAWLVKTDASGNMQWDKIYGGTGNDVAYFLVKTSDGGYAIIGYTASFGGFRVYLVKTFASGNMQWNKTYGTSEIGHHVIQTVDGGYAIAGWNFLNGQDFLLIKTDASGNMQWNMTYGGTGIENAYALLQSSDGGYVITGSTNSFGAGGNDIWLVKTDEAGVVPEGLTIGIMVLASTVVVIVGTLYFRRRPRFESCDFGKP